MDRKTYTFKDIKTNLSGYSYSVLGNENCVSFNNAKSISEADSQSIVWISPKSRDAMNKIFKSESRTIICPANLTISDELQAKKCFILTENPKLIFSVLVNALIVHKPSSEIHSTAFVHDQAELAPDVYVGPFSYVGKCKIGAGSVIWGNCYLHDDVQIARNVEIHAGCVIGDDGSGYSWNEDGEMIKFPHIGGTILEDNVEVGANTYINKGALGNTVIRKGAKIGNSVCIGHNVTIGENSIVIANSVVAGSCHVAENVYIAPSSVIRNKLHIGANATIGMGSVVLKDIPENTTVIGNPAETLDTYKRWSKLKLKLFKMFAKSEKE